MLNFFMLRFSCSILLICTFLSGCASVVNGDSQTIQFATRDTKGDVLEGAMCDWRNSKYAGSFVSPSVVKVRRDYDTLHVTCRADGFPAGSAAVTSKASGAMAGNIIAGGIIGAVVDHSNGNAYEYPSVVIVRLGSDTEISAPQLARGQRETALKHRNASLIPAPSGFASFGDAEAIPTKSQACKDIYLRYTALASPKAIAFLTDGNCSSRTGLDAITAALDSCSLNGTRQCALYAVDNNVVWVKR